MQTGRVVGRRETEGPPLSLSAGFTKASATTSLTRSKGSYRKSAGTGRVACVRMCTVSTLRGEGGAFLSIFSIRAPISPGPASFPLARRLLKAAIPAASCVFSIYHYL